MITNYKVFTISIFTCICLFFVPSALNAQILPDIDSDGISQLSDQELTEYWEQIRQQGYTIEQIKSVALLQGYSQSDIDRLEQRVQELGLNNTDSQTNAIDNSLEIKEQESFGMDGSDRTLKKDKNPLFGYDFFSNENITFTPNINLATPESYQLGPGDELVINLWGAAEQTYEKAIDRQGAIRIEGVGPIYLGGLSIKSAEDVIKQKLRRIYAGLNAAASSAYKVNVDIALINVRSVQVDIIGEVKVPGTYSLSALSNVLNGLYASGGPTTFGTFRDVKLVRDGETIGVFDIYKYLLAGSQEGNLNLKDRDVIIVSPYISRVNVAGSVKRPGIYEMLPDEDILDLLKFTSGFKSNAYKDLIILERIDGDRKQIKEIAYNNASLINLKDGDAIFVRETIDKFINKVAIEGAVFRPGPYELTSDLTLSELIEKAAGLKEDAFLDRGILLRTTDGITKRVESFSVAAVVAGNTDITLQPDDVVRIYSNYSLEEEYSLTIDGAVNNPSTFKFMENMTIEDLVIMAGGFTDAANPNIIDIFRRVNDDEFETLSQNFKVTASGNLTTESGEPFVLQPNDKVSVRYLKGAEDNIRAVVVGEANFPGTYSIETKGERISDLLERAGGISPYAYANGASLVRLNPYYKGDGQNISYNELNENLYTDDSLGLKNQREFRIGIDLGAILKDKEKNKKYDLIIQNGDRLIIPSFEQTVKVEGSILVPSLVRFDEKFTLTDYISKSGGFSQNAKRSKTYVIYRNGDIASTKRFLFFKSYPKLKPGALILVPAKQLNPNRLSVQEVVGLSTGMATFGLIIDRIFN